MRRAFPFLPEFLSLIALMGLVAFPANADELQGAQALLTKLNLPASPPNPPAPAAANSGPVLLPDVAAFSSQLDKFSATEAGQKWADLVLHFQKANETQFTGASLQDQGVFQVLPGPSSWSGIEEEMEARASDSGVSPQALLKLKLLVHTLANSEDKQWADLRALSDASASAPATDFGQTSLETALHLGEKLSLMAGSPDDVESFWKIMLTRLAKTPAFPDAAAFANATHFAHMPVGYGGGIDLPDLVTLLGSARAEPLLLQALLLQVQYFSSVTGIETQRLARKLALENIDQLKQPPWVLTENLEGAPLYEALNKKFPDDPGAKDAAIYYVIALVTQGRSADALKAAADVDSGNIEDATEQAAEHGWAAEVCDFLHRYLAQHPDRAGWEEYVTLAAQTGHAADALQFVQDTIARKDLSAAARAQVLPVLYRALLANDQVDAGIAQLRALIEIQKSMPPDNSQGYVNFNTSLLSRETDLARLGHVLQRADLEDEGISGALQAIQSPKVDAKNPGQSFMQSYENREFIIFLLEIGRTADAEKLLFDSIVQAANARNAPRVASLFGVNQISVPSSQEDLIALAQIYYDAGRWNDILTLLQQVPGWDSADLVGIADERLHEYRYSTPSLGLMAARALTETGRLPEARAILDDVLRVDSGDDAAYELLLKIGQGDLVAQLDTLYHQDQFENRPLIWKAVLQLRQGQVDAAEQTCKAAIAVDPSDGQTGKGNRMRVYSVMAEIEAAKKDTQQATFFGNVIKAIRLSENADDFFDAGLLTHAVGMYSKALDLFADAYCIQSRIARQLASLGRMQEAAVHYRKAFELMPVSFGRLESHCFGCERAFEGKTAEDIAEKTFTDMLQKDPAKPQLHYLLGYLRKEEQRYTEALPEFVKAARLDPDYINAWKQITEIGQDYQLAPDLRDEAVFNLIRLDPAGRHVTPDVQKVRQLAKLWTVVEDAQKSLLPAPSSLLPLAVTNAPSGTTYSIREETRGVGSPRDAVLQNDVIASLISGSP